MNITDFGKTIISTLGLLLFDLKGSCGLQHESLLKDSVSGR